MSCTLLFTCGPNGLTISTRDEFVISDVTGKVHCGVTMSILRETEDDVRDRKTDVHSGAACCKESIVHDPTKTVMYPRENGVLPDVTSVHTSDEKGQNGAEQLQQKKGAKQQLDAWKCTLEGLKVDVPPCEKWSSAQDSLEDSQRYLTEVENCYSQIEKTSRNSSRIEETIQATKEVEIPPYSCKLVMVECERNCETTKAHVNVMQSHEMKVWVVLDNFLKVYSCMVLLEFLSQQLRMHRLSLQR